MMAMMSMQELFYGEREASYFAHYGRQTVSRRMEFTTVDLMVPMCCRKCEDEVRGALFALRSVTDVVCDPYNQRVTVTGYLDPAQALQQAKRVKSGATYWSGSSSRYQVSSYQKPQYRSNPNHSNRSRSGQYSWTSCPGGYRASAVTHVVSVTPTTATRVEMAC